MGLELLQAPAEPVVTLAEAQTHLRASDPEEDSLIASLVEAATVQAEAYCRRRFVSQKWRLTLDAFPADALVLPYPALISVESVKYVDTDGVEQTLDVANYVVRTAETPGEIVRAYGASWPSARDEPGAVRVEFTAGYGAADAVPDAVKRAVLTMVGTLYANRESIVTGTIATKLPQSAEWLLGPHRVLRWS